MMVHFGSRKINFGHVLELG